MGIKRNVSAPPAASSADDPTKALLERAAPDRAIMSEVLIQRALKTEQDRIREHRSLQASEKAVANELIARAADGIQSVDGVPQPDVAFVVRANQGEIARNTGFSTKTVGKSINAFKLKGIIASLQCSPGNSALMYVAFGDTSKIEADLKTLLDG